MTTLLYGLAGRLVGDLCAPLVKDYVGKPWELGSKSEFEKIKNSVSAIEAVLLDAEEKQRTNRQVLNWLIKIKRVFYDLEDLLQEVRTEALKRQVKTKNKKAKKVRIFFSSSNQLKFRFKMGRKVKLIRERLDAIASDRSSFSFTFTERKEEIPRRREETHSFVPIDQFVGRHADRECVTKYLFQPDKVSVISIIGIGGIGKTTLAQSIYDSEDVKSNFERRMWVCVSVPFDVKKICENIIESATKTKCDRLQMDGVKDELKKAIDGRKYLLVLDDVWNESNFEWRKLESLLACGAEGSKILITARAELVARVSSSIETHVLKGLSHDDSWALFKQVAFKQGVEQMNPTMERIGKAVIEKCVGVPLVVKAIGSMLAIKEGETDWLDFEKNDLPRVAQDSEGTVLPILRLSYDNLSAHLKSCFAFCAIYPKDYLIPREELIGMWMAHGLIQLDGTPRSLEDVGVQHFKYLLDRSFFEVHWGGTYKMHDLIHDLAQSVGGNEYYNPDFGVNSIDKSTCHAWVSIHKPSNLCLGEKLRTLALTETPRNQVDEITSTFQQLRVLRLAQLKLRSVPIFVSGSRHLYYLDLSGNRFDSLPDSICCLYNLQTLILSECWNLEELPSATRYLVNLRCLDIRGCDKLMHMPRGLQELTCLQTLTTFVAGGSGEEGGKRIGGELCELKSLINLRGLLAITNLRASKSLKREMNRSYILKGLKLVKELELKWVRIYSFLTVEEEDEELVLIESLKPHPDLKRLVIFRYPGKKFPSWLDRVNIGVSLSKVVYINLLDCGGLRHLPAFGLLPCLQKLHVEGMGSVEYLIDSSSSTLKQLFPSLKELSLSNMGELKRLVDPTESSQTAATTNNNRYFRVLEKLEISSCPLFLSDRRKEDVKQFVNLREVLVRLSCTFVTAKTLPAWFQYLPHLQTLILTGSFTLVSLPEWMGNLTSLQELHLKGLYVLASLPDCIQRLTSLQRLVIERCPKLESRCEKETGVDWHKIAHIPNISVMKYSPRW